MGLYKRILIQEGFPETRAEDIERGINLLHKAICFLDNERNKLFWSKTVETRLYEFAKLEGLNEVNSRQNSCGGATMIKYVQSIGTWRENERLIPRKITRQNDDTEIKKLCAKYLQEETQNQEGSACSN